MSDADKSTTVKEGAAEIVLPKGVFYNPVQEFNRDLTVAVICGFQKLHEQFWNVKQNETARKTLRKEEKDLGDQEDREYKGIRILEALAASGLRSTRFALEISGVQEIIANDFDPTAAELICTNAASNGPESQRLIKATCKDANLVMIEQKNSQYSFDVIDLDPYGSAAKFLPMALASVSAGGLLCVTCTDAAVLCGAAGGTSFGRYGAVSIRCSPSHEMALRILLHSIQHYAAVEGRCIQPILSLSADFYFRVFVRVFKGAGGAKQSACRSAMVYFCNGCHAHHFQPLGKSEDRAGGNIAVLPARGPPVGPSCDICGGHFNVAGPIWNAEIHDVAFVEKLLEELRKAEKKENGDKTDEASDSSDRKPEAMEVVDKSSDKGIDFNGIFRKATLKTKDRIVGVLSMISEELPDSPLYYRAEHLARVVHCHVPPMMKLRSAILNAGYRVSSTHVDPMAFKTDAPAEVIWDIFRVWVKTNPIKKMHLENPNTPCARILSKQPEIDVSFDLREDANPSSRKEGLLRFQINPEKFWGPKARAKRGTVEGETMNEKQRRLQGKRKLTEQKSSHAETISDDP